MPVTSGPLADLIRIQGEGSPRYAEVPRFREVAKLSTEEITEQCQVLFDDILAAFKTLEASASTMNMRDLLDGLDTLQDKESILVGSVFHINSVIGTDAVRDAVAALQPKYTELGLQMSQSVPVFEALERVQKDAESDADKRSIELELRSRKLQGIGLDEEKATRFNAIQTELSNLGIEFQNHVKDATKKWQKLVTDKEDLKGLPESYMEEFATKAKENGHPEATADKGPWMLGVDHNAYLPCIKFCDNRDLRKELLKGRQKLASPVDKETDNVDLINRILKLKAESAEILGFKNYAELSCSKKMATPEEAMGLMESTLEKAMPFTVKEHEDLQAFATKHGFEGSLEEWDVSYWAEKEKKEQYDFDEELLKPYFEFDKVMDGLFSLLSDIFAIDVKPFDILDGTQWDEQVRFYEIQKDDKTVAFFFVDPFARPGSKNAGAWMNDVCGRNGLKNDRIPVAHIVLNNTPPTESKPSLLLLREVETVFHEMGHALQHMLTQISAPSVAGINGVEWDVVELPSQFMENFVYQYDLLASFAKHFETDEVLPRELFDKMEKAKNYRAGTFVTRQLRFGMTDFLLHSTYDARNPGEKTPQDLYKEVTASTSVFPASPEDYFLCQFSHIFAGGYSAGYFSYLWAEVMSADAFAAFEDVGLENKEAVKAMGHKFRDTVLALGGSRHPADVYELFRGHKATTDALLRHKGLVKSA